MTRDSGVIILQPNHTCQPPDETHRGCPRRAPGASRGTARENRGPWRAWEAGCPVRAGAGDHRAGAPGRVREGVRGRTRGGCRRGVRPVAGRGAGGRASAPGGGGQAPAGPAGGRSPGAGPASTPDGRSEDPPAGAGRRRRGSRGKAPQGVHACRADPLEGVGEIRRRAPPRTRPSGPNWRP